jgi:DNA-binding MarR family transcriptional regulator
MYIHSMTSSTKGKGDAEAVRVMDALRRLVRVLSTSARSQARRGGVSGAQLFVLRQVAAQPGLTIGELAERTFSSQSTVSGVVARLVAKGLVARRAGPTDARQTVLTLTRRGVRAIEGAAPVAQERLARALVELPAHVRSSLADGLEAWLGAAGFSEEPATMFFEPNRSPRRRRA